MSILRTVGPLFRLALLIGLLGAGLQPFGAVVLAQGTETSRKAAEEALRGGLAAQKAGKHNDAIAYFSQAISVGALQRKQLTLALYRRGISHRATKKPAQAISDLNSALFFKGDLSSQDRAGAVEERMRAYQDAGLTAEPAATASSGSQWAPTSTPGVVPKGDASAAGGRVVTAVPPRVQEPVQAITPRRTTTALAPTTPILGPDTGSTAAVAAPSRGASPPIPQFETRVTAAAAPLKQVRPVAPAAAERKEGSGAIGGWQTATRSTAEPAASNASGGQTVAGFFSNLFGTQATPPDTKTIVTGGVGRAEAPSGMPAVRQPSRPAVPASVAVVQPSRPAETAISRAGQYEIQVASLRSKDRAEALAKQLMVQYPAGFLASAKQSRVIESNTRAGDLIYAVRYGSFESKADVASMCEKFVADGLDCLVVR